MATFMSILFFSLLPDPPFTASKRGIIRTWRRSRFIQKREDEVEEKRKAEEWREIAEQEKEQVEDDTSSDEDVEIVKKTDAENSSYSFSFYKDWTVVEKTIE
jgi:phosphopantothenoylcysteine synthetase/decarboxylase